MHAYPSKELYTVFSSCPSRVSYGQSERHHDDALIYARKIAAKAARPATAIELPTVLAAPVKGVIGELLGLETTLEVVSIGFAKHVFTTTYPVPDGEPVPD